MNFSNLELSNFTELCHFLNFVATLAFLYLSVTKKDLKLTMGVD